MAAGRVGRVVAALSPRVEDFARRSATAVRLEDLYKWGQGDQEHRLRMARFLHDEIAIRNAQLAKELRLLPFGLAETQGVSDVVSWFSSYVDRLCESPMPENAEDEQRFTALLESILEDNTDVVHVLGNGIRQVREALGPAAYEEVRPEVDLILDRFFIKRIGLRFLLSHHIESAKVRPGVSGIIHSNVKVGAILRSAAKEAQKLCEEWYGLAPEVEIIGDGMADSFAYSGSMSDLTFNRIFTYVPMHLQFSCSVLLQNACFAVAQRQRRSSRPTPSVKAIFAHGEEEVTVKISDEGGGIPRSELPLAFSYFSQSESLPGGPSRGHRHSSPLGAGNPVGAGLPLARLHARYYGGNLVLKSIEGFGTDAYLFLNRLGENCESLPHGVRVSPSMRDSEIGDSAVIGLDSLGTINEREAAFLQRRLGEYRAWRQAEGLPLSLSAP